MGRVDVGRGAELLAEDFWVLGFGEVGEEEVALGLRNDGRAGGVLMAVEAAEALQDEIDGGEIGEEDIGIEIDGLFDNLGADEDAFLTSFFRRMFGEALDPFPFQFLTAGAGEATVEEADGEAFLGFGFQGVIGFLGFLDGVLDDKDAGTGVGLFQGEGEGVFWGGRVEGDVFKFLGDGGDWVSGGLVWLNGGDEGIGGGGRQGRVGLSSGGGDEAVAGVGGEGGREDDDGGAKGAGSGDEAAEEGEGVVIIGVNLIEDDDLSAEGKGAEGGVLDGEDGEEGLVDGADAEGGEEGAAGRREPPGGFLGIGAGGLARADKESLLVTEPGGGVDEALGVGGGEGCFEESGEALVDAVAGELGGEGEVEAAFFARMPAAGGGGEGGFSFSGAHGGLDQIEAGGVAGLVEDFLEGVWGEADEVFQGGGGGEFYFGVVKSF